MRRSERQLPSLTYGQTGADAVEHLLKRGPTSRTRALLHRFLPTLTRSRDTTQPDHEQGLEHSR